MSNLVGSNLPKHRSGIWSYIFFMAFLGFAWGAAYLGDRLIFETPTSNAAETNSASSETVSSAYTLAVGCMALILAFLVFMLLLYVIDSFLSYRSISTDSIAGESNLNMEVADISQVTYSVDVEQQIEILKNAKAELSNSSALDIVNSGYFSSS